MSALKVLTVLGFALEAAGLDIGISRLLLTFLLSCVPPHHLVPPLTPWRGDLLS